MSAIIAPVTPVNVGSASQPLAGSTVSVVDGASIAITDPDAGATDPVTIVAPASGTISIAPATAGANVVVEGTGNATIDLSPATSNGNPQNLGGSIVQVNEDYKGDVVANFDDAIVDGTVDVSTDTGFGSISDNAPATAGDFNFYINTGAGNDQIKGTVGNDFIRAGAGNDVVNSGAGNDVVRLGTGTDEVTLGTGEDVVYFTVDQLETSVEQTKTITDFDSGVDAIQINADLEGRLSIERLSADEVRLVLSGDTTGITKIISAGDDIADDDIEFV